MKKRLFNVVVIALVFTLSTTAAVFAAVPSDVQGQDYETAVAELMNKGIITGDENGLYHPNDTLNRAQVCTLVVKAMDPPSAEVVGTPTQKVSKSGFSDMTGYTWADGYIAYAVKSGITKGIGSNQFAPGANVTVEEIVAMVLRAQGYSDNDLTGSWPDNYMNKAKELGLFKDLDDPAKLPNPATKALAAQLIYNGLGDIEKAQKKNELNTDKKEDTSKKEENETSFTGEFIPGTTKMTYGTGSFNENMTSYGGKSISSGVEVYTYGLQKGYSADMELPKDKTAYSPSTVYRFKMTSTPCFYALKNGKITAMVLPSDAGFSGTAYGVVNSIDTVTNGNDEKVMEINSLTAGKKIDWMTKKENISGLPDSADLLNGEVYEMAVTNGEVKKMYKAGEHKKDFKELTSGNQWNKVKSYSSRVVELDNGKYITIADNAAIYVISDGDTTYRTGTVNSIKDKVSIRAYTINGDSVASIVTVLK